MHHNADGWMHYADFEGPIESLGKPWRIFTDPAAIQEVLDFAEEYHWEMEHMDWEALLQGRHYAVSSRSQGDDACTTSGDEGALLFEEVRVHLLVSSTAAHFPCLIEPQALYFFMASLLGI